ncbi:chloride channel protein [Chloroflexota bacterium]
MENNLHRQFLSRLSQRATHWLDTHHLPEWSVVMGTAIIVGIGSGLGAVVFRWLIETAQWLFFDVGAQVFSFLGDYYIIVIPALGGLIVGPLIYFFAREAKGHGVPEVMEAVALRGGRIRPRVAIVKSLASAITIGSGGSVGREGPIVQIGSTLGSTVGQVLGLSSERIRSLVACGAAAGIAATFNAPIAGTLFALEVILGEFHSMYFGAVVISAVIADVIVHILEGSARAFIVPPYELASPAELLLYALLGVLAALISVVYAKGIYFAEDLFESWKRLPETIKPVVGGLLLGILGAVMVAASQQVVALSALTFETEAGNLIPSVYGVGYEMLSPALLGQLTIGSALILLFAKLLATGLTLGSGGSGGVFAPSLFLGAMLGVVFGSVVNMIFPAGVGPVGAYALVGMSALFAGASHAPATAILIIFEMTGDYDIILPLMLATVVSLIVSRAISTESIYTLKLARRGVRLQHGRDIDLLESVNVTEAMTSAEAYGVVTLDMSVLELVNRFERTHLNGYPVIGEDHLVGMVTVSDVDQALLHYDLDELTVQDIATTQNLLVAYPDETLGVAMQRMSVRDIGRLPVVPRGGSYQLIGVLERDGIISAYRKAVATRDRVTHRLRTLGHDGPENFDLIEIDITAETTCISQTLREIAQKLPEDSIVVSVQRGKEVLIPHGNTTLEPGDRLVVLANHEREEHIRATFC